MMAFISTPHLRHLLTFAGLLIAVAGVAQQRDSVLINETTLSRPLVVHQNQLRINGGYNFEIHNVEYVGTERTRLFDSQKAGVGHRFGFVIEYGILENLQASLAVDYLNQSIRYENATVVDDPFYDLFFIQEKVGWSDPAFSLTYRLPLPKTIDVLVSGVATLPMAAHGNIQPEHQIVLNQEGDPDFDLPQYYTVNYIDREGVGAGVAFLGLSSTVKYRFTDQFAITAHGSYMAPQDVSEEKRWYFTLVDDEHFEYESTNHEKQFPDLQQYSVAMEFQAFPTFNVYSELWMTSRRYGWTDISGQKVKIPEQEYAGIRLGYEIIATPKVWLSQYFELPVSGENTIAPFIINTRIRYNVLW